MSKKVTQEKDIYTEQQKLAITAFLSDIPTFCALVVSIISTGSMVVWMDFLDCLCGELHQLFIVALSRWLRKDLKYAYNYGVGKIEAVASIGCDSLLFFSVLGVVIFSVIELFNPQQPSGFLIAVVGLKGINVLVDVYFYVKQLKVCKVTKSHVLESELANAKKDLMFDSATLICVLISFCVWDFRPGWYISPIACIILGLMIMREALLRLKTSIDEILDKTADEDVQIEILKILSATCASYDEFEMVKTRTSGNTLYIDLYLKFAPDTTYEEIEKYRDLFQETACKTIENAKVNVTI